jgi:glutathione S-transferase
MSRAKEDLMLLIGMLDSPYVRRAAIMGTLLGLKFEHRSISVFRHMEAFRAINPLIKAPSLVCDDGTVLTESLLIIQHFEDVAGHSLRPVDAAGRARDLSLTGIGIVAADKAVSVEYENKRPEEKRYQPWEERIKAQLDQAFQLLDHAARDGSLQVDPLTPATIAAVVAYRFAVFVTPQVLGESSYPDLRQLAADCEALPVFRQWPIDRETP